MPKIAVEDSLAQAEARCAELQELYIVEHNRRKQAHNRLLELMGNIRVLCRVRPLSDREMKLGHNAGGQEILRSPLIGADDSIILAPRPNSRETENAPDGQKFEFDHVFLPSSTQQMIFDVVRPLAVSVMDGYNATIFAYGQTGSGKTYTMEGPDQQPDGICFRTFDALFEIAKQRSGTIRYTFHVSMLEIYNEQVRDLLRESSSSKYATDTTATKGGSLTIRDVGPSGGENVPGLSKWLVATSEGCREIMQRGNAARAVGGHSMNERSSRSHSAIRINVIGENEEANTATEARLFLIDLAGSERVSKTDASGERLKEAQAINKSLAALGNVMQALGSVKPNKKNGNSSSSTPSGRGRDQNHVPFRDSKLTYLLKGSLTGGSKVMMIVNVSPAALNHNESLGSLMFASRCRAIELGKAVKNEESSKALALRREIGRLQQELDAAEKETEATKTEAEQLKTKISEAETVVRENTGSMLAQQAKYSEHVEQLNKDKKHLAGLIKNLEEQAAALRADKAKELKAVKDKSAVERKKAVEMALEQAAKQERKQKQNKATDSANTTNEPKPSSSQKDIHQSTKQEAEVKQSQAELADAQFDLGSHFEKGNKEKGVKRSYSEAARWFQKAAALGHCGALKRMGYLYMKGKGVKASDIEAARCYLKAAELDDIMAQYTIGFLYSKGRGVMQDDARAAEWYEKAAKAGNPEAQHNMGVLFDEGRGVKQSYVYACKWYEKAAEQGVSAAQYNLGLAYATGQGVNISEEKMEFWFERAADMGNVAAQLKMGYIKLGKEINSRKTPDIEKAKAFFRMAADNGSADAEQELRKLSEMPGGEIDIRSRGASTSTSDSQLAFRQNSSYQKKEKNTTKNPIST